MIESPYAARTAPLRSDELPRELVASERAGSGPLVRGHAGLRPGLEPFATLVYTQADRERSMFRVEAWTSRPAGAGCRSSPVRHPPVGWLRVVPLPSDPALPALGLVVRRPGSRIVRYRPFMRCTVRVGGDGDARFAKLYPDGRGARIHAACEGLRRAARRGELGFATAEPLGYDVAGRVLWQSGLPGRSAKELLGHGGGAVLAGRIGRAAASLAASSHRPGRGLDREGQLEKAVQRCDQLAWVVPEVADRAGQLAERLRAVHAAIGPGRARPIHGSPGAGHWLVDGPRLGLVDLDDLALGDPELDAATFLAEAGFEGRRRLNCPEIVGAFLAGYETHFPLDRSLLRLYLAQRACRKALAAACALRPRADRRAARHLERAFEWLEDGLR